MAQAGRPLPTDERKAAHDRVRERVRALTEAETDEIALMATVACELHRGIEGFDWVGFYRVTEPETLRIGPYQGGHGSLVIPFSRGICGAAARAEAALIVPDVGAFADHIASSPTTRSEIVVPVFGAGGRLIGVLEAASDRPAHFDETDREALEALVAEVFARPWVETEPAPAPRRRSWRERLPRRLTLEDRVFYGPVLLLAHLLIAGLAWPVELLFAERATVTTAEIVISTFIAVAMMVPVMLILRAYYHGKLSPGLAVSYMMAHAGLIVVGYAGIYGMLEYGPAGGLVRGAVEDTSCLPGWSTDFYFSVITFTTLGYGDCTPYGWARLFAGVEALLSYLFIGTVVGILSGIVPRPPGSGPGQGRSS